MDSAARTHLHVHHGQPPDVGRRATGSARPDRIGALAPPASCGVDRTSRLGAGYAPMARAAVRHRDPTLDNRRKFGGDVADGVAAARWHLGARNSAPHRPARDSPPAHFAQRGAQRAGS